MTQVPTDLPRTVPRTTFFGTQYREESTGSMWRIVDLWGLGAAKFARPLFYPGEFSDFWVRLFLCSHTPNKMCEMPISWGLSLTL
jgi:hypothetical protein